MTAPASASQSFPRQQARTRRFTLGVPRSFTVARDHRRLAWLQSPAGHDPLHRLLVLDLGGDDAPRVAADPRLLDVDDEDLPPEERARRERVREAGGGIVAYAVDDLLSVAAFALGGRLFAADLAAAGGAPAVRELDVEGPVVDPRPDPHGRRVAFVREGALHVTDLDGGSPVCLVGEVDPDVTWGLAEFVAAEEMGRTRGYWWAPDGTRLAVARVDVGPVARWHLTDPADPGRPPTTLRYPAAGTANAVVTLAVVGLDGSRVDVAWERDRWPYLAAVTWQPHGPLTLLVQSRDQRETAVLVVDDRSGAVTVAATQHDDHWVELVPGVPRWLPDGRLVTTVDVDDHRRVAVDGVPLGPADLQVRRVVAVGGDAVLVTASRDDDPTATAVWRLGLDGDAEPLTDEDGVADAAGDTTVTVTLSRNLDRDLPHVEVRSPSGTTVLPVHAETPSITAAPTLLRLGERALATALLLPSGHRRGDGPLPVLLDPYGGPHAQRVVRRRDAFLTSQWFADQGFAVLVCDGRGTPGRGPAWERAVAGDLATPVLDDQVAALEAAAAREPDLDLDRVAIRGWSFGGYLAALAVLRRPDVFAAAVAGAPVTEWRLYDTHYTERYLGDPTVDDTPYRRSSLLEHAAELRRPLLLIHGLADDNVVAAHTLRLSRALLEAGRPHSVLPLSGVTHMTPQEVVAENLLLLQRDFLLQALASPRRG